MAKTISCICETTVRDYEETDKERRGYNELFLGESTIRPMARLISISQRYPEMSTHSVHGGAVERTYCC